MASWPLVSTGFLLAAGFAWYCFLAVLMILGFTAALAWFCFLAVLMILGFAAALPFAIELLQDVHFGQFYRIGDFFPLLSLNDNKKSNLLFCLFY